MRLLDPRWDEAREGYEVLVEGDVIKEVVTGTITSASAEVIECAGRTLMPGLIDCHAHLFLAESSRRALEAWPLTLVAARAVVLARAMLERGCTTVRDTGGADWGFKQAVDEGLVAGPRLFISGQTISTTGGHGDARRRTDGDATTNSGNALRYVSRIADGADAVRTAAREQMRQGPDQVKLMCPGAPASPSPTAATCSALCRASRAASSSSVPRSSRLSRSSVRRRSLGRRSSARRGGSGSSRSAPAPTSCSSTATPSPICAVYSTRARTCARS